MGTVGTKVYMKIETSRTPETTVFLRQAYTVELLPAITMQIHVTLSTFVSRILFTDSAPRLSFGLLDVMVHIIVSDLVGDSTTYLLRVSMNPFLGSILCLQQIGLHDPSSKIQSVVFIFLIISI